MSTPTNAWSDGSSSADSADIAATSVNVTPARLAEFEAITAKATVWATREAAICGLLLVGSWAHGTATMASDADLVVISDTPTTFIDQDDWVGRHWGPSSTVVRTRTWGPLTERRVQLESGFEIEFGFVRPAWASTTPVDPGTLEVVTGQSQVWYDPEGLLTQLVTASARR